MLIRDLEDYQLEGAQFLADRRHAFLADEMGVGKSAQAVRACDLVGARDILVLVPASARVNWIREFEKFSPMDRPAAALMDGKSHMQPRGITVCSYDMLAGNAKLRKSLLLRQWHVIILDEAHYLKSRSASRTKAVYGRKADGAGGLIERAAHCWRMSGTPAPNNVSELWTHLRSAGVYLKNYYDFITDFCTGFDSDYGFKITGTKNAASLRVQLAPFLLRRKKEDVMPELPTLTFEHHLLEPSPPDSAVYFPDSLHPGGADRLKKEVERQHQVLLAAWNGTRGHGDAVDMLEALATSLGTLRRWIALSKVEPYIARVSAELRAGEIDKLVIFAYNTQVLTALMAGLREFEPVVIRGGTPAADRQKHVDRFAGDKTCRVFVGQLQAAGTAINLTAACRLDVLQESYVPGENAQAIMRCHRKGQARPVIVRFFGLNRSLDAEITKAHMRKAKELSKIFD